MQPFIIINNSEEYPVIGIGSRRSIPGIKETFAAFYGLSG
jgi:hypothetical protein